jgi:hypothetical protein
MLLLVTPAQTQPQADRRLDALERQLQDMEASQQKILDLLTRQQPAGAVSQPSPTPDASPSPTPSSGAAKNSYKSGTVLDVWILGNKTADEVVGAGAMAIARIFDGGPFFSLTSHNKEPSLAAYRGQRVALQWAGFMRITDAGQQVIVCDVNVPQSAADGTRVVLSLVDSASVPQDLITLYLNGNQNFFTESASVDLQPGYYGFFLRYLPGTSSYRGAAAEGTITLKLRAGNAALRELGASDFFTRQ